MTEGKYFFKRSSAVQIITYAVMSVVIIIFAIFWIISLFSTSELAFVGRYILGFLTIFGLIAFLSQIFLISKLYYVKLTEREMVIYRVFPKSFKYSEIKRISFSNGLLKGVDTGMYMPWPVLLNIEDPNSFLKELEDKYWKNTDNKLNVVDNF